MATREEDARYIEETQALYLQLRGGGFTLSPLDSDRIRSWRDRGLPLELALQAVRAAHAAWGAGGRGARARPFSLQSAEPFAEELLEVAARRLVQRAPQEAAAGGPRAGALPPGLAASETTADASPTASPFETPPSTAGAGGGPGAGVGPDDPRVLQSVLAPVLEELRRKGPARQPEAPLGVQASGCPRCRGSGYVIGREGAISVASVCGCERSCESCHGRGIRVISEDGYEFARTCECQTLPQRVAAFNAAQLPSRFTDARIGAGPGVREIKGFDRFHVDPGDPPALQKMKSLLQEFAHTARPGQTPKGIGLFGKPGTGKTHLLVATLAHMTLERGIACRYIEISFLFADLKAAISDPKARETVDKIDALAEIDVLAIDELGKGRGSVFDEEVLDELIGRRYNNGKLTLFATNFSLEGGDARERDRSRVELGSQSLRLRVGERVFSRLHEMVDFIDLPPTVRDKRIPAAR